MAALKRDQIIATAEKLVAKGKVPEAIKEYIRLVEDNPTDTNTINRVGDLYVRLNKLDEASNMFAKIATFYATDGFFLKAIAIYKKINKLDPSRLDVYEKLAELYHKQGLAMEAKSQYQVLADYYQKKGDNRAAYEIYGKIADIDPNNVQVRAKLADMAHALGDNDRALKEYDRIGKMMLKKGHFDEGMQVYAKALKLAPNDQPLVEGLVATLNEMGKGEYSVKVLSSVVEANPQNARLLQLLGQSYLSAGNLPEARTTLERALKIDPKNPASQRLLGSAYLQVRDFAAAAKLLIPLTQHFMDQGKPTEAVGILNEILQADPSNLEALQKMVSLHSILKEDTLVLSSTGQLAEAYVARGDFLRAAEILSRLVEMEPENSQHRQKLAFVRQRMSGGAAPAAAPPSRAAAPSPPPPQRREAAPPPTPAADEPDESAVEIDLSIDGEIPVDFEDLAIESAEARPATAAAPAPEGDGEDEDLDFITEHLTEAEVFAKYGLAEKAVEQLQTVLERAPRNVTAHERLLDIHVDQHNGAEIAAVGTRLLGLYRDRGEIVKIEALESKVAAAGVSLGRPGAAAAAAPVAPAPPTPISRAAAPPTPISAEPRPQQPAARVPAPAAPVAETEEQAAARFLSELGVSTAASPAADDDEVELEIEDSAEEELQFEASEVELGSEPEAELGMAEATEDAAAMSEPVNSEAAAPEAAEANELEEFAMPDFGAFGEASADREQAAEQDDVVELSFDEPELESRSAPMPEAVVPAAASPAAAAEPAPSPEPVKPVEIEKPPAPAVSAPVAAPGAPAFSPPAKARKKAVEPDIDELLRGTSLDPRRSAKIKAPKIDRVEMPAAPPPAAVVAPPPKPRAAEPAPPAAAPPAEEVFGSDFGADGAVFGDAKAEDSADIFGEIDLEQAVASASAGAARRGPAIEELAEVDFYVDQGLVDEARRVLAKLEAAHPNDAEVVARIARLPVASAATPPPPASAPAPAKDEEEAFDFVRPPAAAEPPPPPAAEQGLFDDEETFFDLASELEKEMIETPAVDEVEPDSMDLSEEEQSLEEIFKEFKKGVEQQLDSEDYDTHYNLGIAYKEMGLVDEAIGEFQTASKDPKRAIECASMLGLCFLEKGMPQLAIKWYRKGLDTPEISDDENLGILYDLGGVYQEMGDVENAYKTFLEVYGINTNYRDIVHKIRELEIVRQG